MCVHAYKSTLMLKERCYLESDEHCEVGVFPGFAVIAV